MGKAPARKSVSATVVSLKDWQATDGPKLSTLDTGTYYLLIGHAIGRLAKATEGASTELQQNLLGYFTLISNMQINGLVPTLSLLRDKTGATYAGIQKPMVRLADARLIERHTFKNANGKSEVYFAISAAAMTSTAKKAAKLA